MSRGRNDHWSAARFSSPGRRRGPRSTRPGSARARRPGFSHDKAMIFGVVQLLTGISVMVLGVIAISTRSWGWHYGSGLWGGSCCIAAGVFGVASARQKTNCTIATFMVLSTIATILALVILTLSAIGLSTHDRTPYRDQHTSYESSIIVQSLMIVVMMIESVCGTVAAIVGCRAVCGVWYGTDDSRYDSTPLDSPTDSELGARHPYRLAARDHGVSVPGNEGVAGGEGEGGADSLAHFQTAMANISVLPMPLPAEGPGSYIMHRTATGSVMYVMPAVTSTQGTLAQPQPGSIPEDYNPPATPPPSYSTCQLDTVGRGEREGNEEDASDSEDHEPLSMSEAQLQALLSQASIPTRRGAHPSSRNTWTARQVPGNNTAIGQRGPDREVVGARLASSPGPLANTASGEPPVLNTPPLIRSSSSRTPVPTNLPVSSSQPRPYGRNWPNQRPEPARSSASRRLLPSFLGTREQGRNWEDADSSLPRTQSTFRPVSLAAPSPSRRHTVSAPTSPTSPVTGPGAPPRAESPPADSPWVRSHHVTSSRENDVMGPSVSESEPQHPVIQPSDNVRCNEEGNDGVSDRLIPLSTQL